MGLVSGLNYSMNVNLGSSFGGYSSSLTSVGGGRVPSSINTNRIIQDLTINSASYVGYILDYLDAGDVGRALEKYNDFLECASESAEQYGYSLNEANRITVADKAFENLSGGISVSDAFANAGSGAFVTGLKQGFNPFTDDTLTNKEIQAKIAGTTVKFDDSIAEAAGTGVAGAAIGGLVGLGAGAVAKVAAAAKLAGATVPIGTQAVAALGGLFNTVGTGLMSLFVNTGAASGAAAAGALTLSSALPFVIGGAVVIGGILVAKTIYENCKNNKEDSQNQ